MKGFSIGLAMCLAACVAATPCVAFAEASQDRFAVERVDANKTCNLKSSSSAELCAQLVRLLNESIDSLQAKDYTRTKERLADFKSVGEEGLKKENGGTMPKPIPAWAKELSDVTISINAAMVLAPEKGTTK